MVDVFSRKVLAHKVAITLEACHAKEIIEQAFAKYGVPEIVNTDQGSQFTAIEFTDAVLGRGCQPWSVAGLIEMQREGHCKCYWWRNTEPNPRPLSEQKSARKNSVPVLNHLAVSADSGRNGWTVWLAVFDAATGNQSPSETPGRIATTADNALAFTWQGDCITMRGIHPFDRRAPCPPPSKSNPR